MLRDVREDERRPLGGRFPKHAQRRVRRTVRPLRVATRDEGHRDGLDARGGQGAFYAAMARFHRLWNPGGVIPAATLAIYPDCGTRYIEDTVMVPRPIRVFHGTPDDFNPVAPVRAHLERLRAAGCDVALAEYAGAHHGFDNPLSRVAARTSGQSVRDCRIEEQAPGLLVNAATGEPFGYADPCVARDAHVGGNPAAAGMLRVDVMACLAALIGR